MSLKIAEFKAYTGTARDGLGTNSLDTSSTLTDNFVSITGNVVGLATTNSVIAGVSLSKKVYASDNQTVAKIPLVYIPTDVDALYQVTISGGTITAAKEGNYYRLTTTANIVDGSTESSTTGQVQLVKYISSTLGNFRIVNK